MANNPLISLLDLVISSELDPPPIVFMPKDECGVRPVRNACMDAEGKVQAVRNKLNRNAFLCGCLDFTEHEPIEHLIVGFGKKFGTTTKIERIAHVSGSKRAVSIPGDLEQTIRSYLLQGQQNEVLLFHNHPHSLLDSLCDPEPLASTTDRNTFLRYYSHLFLLLKALLSGGRVSFYLGQNRFVREIRVPNVLQLLEKLRT